MADVSITQLDPLAPSTNTYVPISNGTTTGKAIYNPVPVGGIIMWSGSIVSIPTGWALCNGQNGTPNLTSRFIIAAGGTYTPGITGDASFSYTPVTVASDGHSHSQWDCSCQYYIGTTANYGSTVVNSITSSPLPAYYALAYIMRTI